MALARRSIVNHMSVAWLCQQTGLRERQAGRLRAEALRALLAEEGELQQAEGQILAARMAALFDAGLRSIESMPAALVPAALGQVLEIAEREAALRDRISKATAETEGGDHVARLRELLGKIR